MRSQVYFVGIDLHKELIQVCVLDAQGKVVHEQKFPGKTREQGLAVVKFLCRWKGGGRYAVEAVGMNRWLVNAMREQGLDVNRGRAAAGRSAPPRRLARALPPAGLLMRR